MKGDKISYRGGYKYSLWEDYRVQTDIKGFAVDHRLFRLDPDGWLTIMADYPWDGVTGFLDLRCLVRGSLVHDSIYEMLRLALLPHYPCFHLANRELRKIALEDDCPNWMADCVFWFVERKGSAFARRQQPKILKAP